MLQNEKNKPKNERYDLVILKNLRKIMRSVDIHSRKLSNQYDITAPQLIVLMAIAEYSPVTIASIAKQVHLSASTLVGVIDRLETKKYVVRERSEQDRRQVFISLTDDGKEFVNKAPSPLQERLATELAALPKDEQATIANSLERIVELMEAKEIDAAPILQTGAITEK